MANPFRDLAIIVVNYGRSDLLQRCLVPVSIDLAPARAVVVDNYSTPEVRDDVRQLCDARQWTGLFPAENTGFGTASNLGATAAIELGARHLLFLNPDATIDPESVSRLVEALVTDPSALVGPVIRNPRGGVPSAGIDLDLETGDMRGWARRPEWPGALTMPWLSGSCFAVTADMWRAVGGFDDRYFLYWEDVDLCARWLRAGGNIAVVRDAVALHEAGQTHTTAGTVGKSTTYYYYNVRNRQLFAALWLPPTVARRWLLRAPAAAYRILRRGGRRQFLHPVAPLLAVVRGLRDGVRMAHDVSPSPSAREFETLLRSTDRSRFITVECAHQD